MRRYLVVVGLMACAVEPYPLAESTERQVPHVPSDADLGPIAPHFPCGEGGMTDCQAIDIVETTIAMVGGGMGTANVQQLSGFSTMLVSATIAGPAEYTFNDSHCMGMQSCTFGPDAVPYPLEINCANPTTTAVLQVLGTRGPMDTDSAQLTCGAAGPTISVSPGTISTLTTAVGAPLASLQQITVTNNGTGDLTYSVSNGDSQFALSAGCTGFPNCVLAGGGSQHVFTLTFTPTMHHPSPITDTFTFDGGAAGMPTVQVSGMGTGAVLDVSPLSHDFLQLARNAMGTQSITITNQGNAAMTVAISGATAPFGATSTGFMNIMPSSSEMFDATCQSATAITPATNGSISITSNAYGTSSQTISLRCEVLPTDLQITPNPVDFREIRKGTQPDPTIAVTLFNNSAATETVTGVSLVGPNALTRTGFSSGPIAGSSSEIVTLALDTASEIDLSNARLEVALAGQPTPLAIPIQGAVVVPSASVVPEVLDLGTACVGSQVTGVVRMINDGTATLVVERPTMDQAFLATSSSTYPLQLVKGNEVAVDVTPAMVNLGPKSGMLTWQANALGELLETFRIPVDLTFIPDGAAVSPGKVEFGEHPISSISSPSTVTLRNCNPDPILVRVEGLSATRGSVDAWMIEPRMVERTLASQDTLSITTRFAPQRTGRHEAKIVLRVEGEQRLVDLIGFGTGAGGGDPTSLYACDCSGGKHPWGGLPVGLAILAICRRRKGIRALPRHKPTA